MTLPGDSLEPINFVPPSADARASSIDIKFLLGIVTTRWKLITATVSIALLVTYGVLGVTPRVYKSTVEVLVFDPERQVEQDIQKTLFPFRVNVDNVAMNTEIEVIKSKSLALGVAEKLGLDKNTEFLTSEGRVSSWLERLGLIKLRASSQKDLAEDAVQSKALRLDRASTAVRMHLDAERLGASYILVISATFGNPAMAQRLAAAAADEFLSSQREARQGALQGMMAWFKSRLQESARSDSTRGRSDRQAQGHEWT